MKAAADTSRTDLLEPLSKKLLDPDPAVRMFADIALRKLTGRDFDFKPHGTPAEREEAHARWDRYIQDSKSSGGGEDGKTDAKITKHQE